MRAWFRRYSRTIVLGSLVAAQVAIYPIAISAYVTTRAQAADGARARERQCDVAPAAQRLYRDAYARGVITRRDVQLIEGGLPARCLP